MDSKTKKNKYPLLAEFRSTVLDIIFVLSKAIDAKNKMYKTMNFEGILEHPLQPNLVIYGKKRVMMKPKPQNPKSNRIYFFMFIIRNKLDIYD